MMTENDRKIITMAVAQKYTIEILAEAPPRLCLGDVLAGGKIVTIKCANDEPDAVSAAWLANRLNISKSTVTTRCQMLNMGTVGKGLYPREQAIALLTTKEKRRGRPRAN